MHKYLLSNNTPVVSDASNVRNAGESLLLVVHCFDTMSAVRSGILVHHHVPFLYKAVQAWNATIPG